MTFIYDRKLRAAVDLDSGVIVKKTSLDGKAAVDGMLILYYTLTIGSSSFRREAVVTENDIKFNFSEERDEYNIRKKTVELGVNPWQHYNISSTVRIDGDREWNSDLERLFRDGIYCIEEHRLQGCIERLRISFGFMGDENSTRYYTPPQSPKAVLS